MWVGIDGDTCYDVILQTGIDVSFDGDPSYTGKLLVIFRACMQSSHILAWYEWYPDTARDFKKISIHADDEIRLTVTATSSNSGKAMIENLTTKKHIEKVFHSQDTPLCQQNAEWIVEDYQNDEGEDVPVCNFGKVEFTHAYATTTKHNHRVTPDGADIILMRENGQVITSVKENRNGVTIKYL